MNSSTHKHEGHPTIVGQTNAVYCLMDILQEKYPNVEIESFSSDGGRIDFKVLKRLKVFGHLILMMHWIDKSYNAT